MRLQGFAAETHGHRMTYNSRRQRTAWEFVPIAADEPQVVVQTVGRAHQKGGTSVAVRIEVSEEISRPVAVVFRFFADDHVRNHPRWDPYIELWRDSDEPIGVGTIIHRRNSRSGTPIEGTMQVVEYQPNRVIGMITRDGSMEIPGRATFEEAGEGRTRLTLIVDMPIDESMKEPVTGTVQESLQNIKELIEKET